MKNLLKQISYTVCFGLIFTACEVSQPITDSSAYIEPTPSVNFSVFYNSLSPYGRWVEYPSYGKVWVCNEAGFAPYRSGGHWIYANVGWTWSSDYNWGWAPFHYGRWMYDPMYGWIWVPGYEWAPAWVSWRSGGGYYGWAPLAPGFSINANATFGNIPAEHWCFVPNKYMGHPDMHNFYENRINNTTIINKTTIINNTNIYNNTKYLSGPERTEVERNAGRKFNTVNINDAKRPEEAGMFKNNYTVYKPNVSKANPPRMENKPEQHMIRPEIKPVRPKEVTTLPGKRDTPHQGGIRNIDAARSEPREEHRKD